MIPKCICGCGFPPEPRKPGSKHPRYASDTCRKRVRARRSARYRARNKTKVAKYEVQRYLQNKEREAKRMAAYERSPKGKAIRTRIVQARRAVAGFCTEAQWQARVSFYGGRCYLCGRNWRSLPSRKDARPGERWKTIEHVKPISRDGTDWPANRRPACNVCNCKKQAKVPDPVP